MKITRVEAIPYRIPYRKPLRFASGEVHAADHVLVRVHTDDGVVGVADAPPRPFTYGETQRGVVAVIEDLFAEQVVGTTLLARGRPSGRASSAPSATRSRSPPSTWRCGMRWGAASTCPSATCSAATPTGCASATCSGSRTPEAMVDEAIRMRDTRGITVFKVKVGRRPVELDTAVVRALRDGLGDGIELYVDGNRGWTAAESARAMDDMADLGLTLAEELCPADDVVSRRWLVQRLGVPFVADESATTPAEVTREILGGSATALSIKTARTGFTGSVRVHHLCEGLGVDVVMGIRSTDSSGRPAPSRSAQRSPRPRGGRASCRTSSTCPTTCSSSR